MSHISYSDDELTIPTFYCSECKTDTVGFSICLKCNPQTYTVGKPDVIKAALSVGKQEESVLYKEIWNEAIETAAKLDIFQDGWISEEIRKLKK